MEKLLDPFAVEKLRHNFAKKLRIKEFKKTYDKTFPEIKNLNSPKLWDDLNSRDHIDSTVSPMTVHKIRLMSEYIPNKKLKVINIGCGAGDMENMVFNIQKKILLNWAGVDISSKSIKSCKKEFPKSNFFVGDIRQLNFANKSFDMVTLMEILEHIRPRDLFKSLSEVKRVLKDGGKLIVSVPTNEGLSEMLKHGANPNAHVRDYSEEILKAELNISGFTVIQKKELFAFPNWYWVKYFLAKYIFPKKWQPNSLIVLAQKD